jgi:hypothetical protein
MNLEFDAIVAQMDAAYAAGPGKFASDELWEKLFLPFTWQRTLYDETSSGDSVFYWEELDTRITWTCGLVGTVTGISTSGFDQEELSDLLEDQVSEFRRQEIAQGAPIDESEKLLIQSKLVERNWENSIVLVNFAMTIDGRSLNFIRSVGDGGSFIMEYGPFLDGEDWLKQVISKDEIFTPCDDYWGSTLKGWEEEE